MKLVDDRTGLEVLSRDECVRLLASASVGRFVVVAGGRPHVVPVNFVLDGEAIVFRTDPGTKLSAIERSPIAFEVDDYDVASRTGWSVVVHGTAEELTTFDDPARSRAMRELAVDPWAGGDKVHWVRIDPVTVTGRRIGVRT